jgi:Uma2 family endonuclease
MSVEEYFQLEQESTDARYEYIDGYAHMLAGGSADHSTIKQNVLLALKLALRGTPCRVYDADMKARLSEERYVLPDASVSCNPHDRGKVTTIQSPCLIVEVLSPGTEAYDRGRKFHYYQDCRTIEEYVLIDTYRQAVEVFRREKNHFWTYALFTDGDQVELRSIGIKIPVADVYEDVVFVEDDERH